MFDGLQEILYTLRQNKLRTGLTAFGVFWGIFMLMLLLGAGRGMQNGVYEDFGSDVMDFIVVYTGTTSVAHKGMGLGRYIQLTLEDIDAIKQQVPGIRLAAGENQRNGVSITYRDKNANFSALGVPKEYFDVKESIPFNVGRKINQLDQQELRKVTVIGTVVAERLFGPGVDPINKEIR